MTTFDPAAVLRLLARHDVDFVLVGGLAAVVHGSPLATFDVDVCYARDDDNLARLAGALREVHARLRGADDDVPFVLDARTLRMGDAFTFVTDLGPVDILGHPSGSGGYSQLLANAARVDFDGVTIAVVSLDDLIRMKRAAGRAKDLFAVENLLALRDEINRGGG